MMFSFRNKEHNDQDNSFLRFLPGKSLTPKKPKFLLPKYHVTSHLNGVGENF
jgi:hypothetical protein